MCNIVTEFYLYSIVYIHLINSRLDVTNSVRHHFRTATLSWCQRVVGFSRNWENLTAIEFTTATTMTNRSDTLSWCQISGKNSRNRRENLTVIELTQHFKRLFERTLNIQTSSETIRYDHSIWEM